MVSAMLAPFTGHAATVHVLVVFFAGVAVGWRGRPRTEDSWRREAASCRRQFKGAIRDCRKAVDLAQYAQARQEELTKAYAASAAELSTARRRIFELTELNNTLLGRIPTADTTEDGTDD